MSAAGGANTIGEQRRKRRSRAVWLAALLLFTIALTFASLTPVRHSSALGATPMSRLINNLLHAPAYGMLAWLCSAALLAWRRRAAAIFAAWFGGVAATAYGALMEVAQRGVPGRYAAIEDVLFNVIGAAAATLMLIRSARRREQAADKEEAESAASGGRV